MGVQHFPHKTSYLPSIVNVTSHDSGTYICRLENDGLGEGLEVQTVLEVCKKRPATVFHRSINQPSNQAINQAINQPINQSIKVREERPATVVYAKSSVVLVQGGSGKVSTFQKCYCFSCMYMGLYEEFSHDGKAFYHIYICTNYDIKRATFSSRDGDLTLAIDVFCTSHPHPLQVQAQTFSLECLEGLCCWSTLSLYQVSSLLSILLQLMGMVDCWKWVASLLSSFFLNLKLSSQTSPFLLS